MKLKAKVMYTMVISISLLFVNCKPVSKKDSIWIEINRISETPLKKEEIKKVGLYFKKDIVEVHKYMIDSVTIGTLDRANLLEKIQSDLKNGYGSKVSNTFIFKHGALHASGYINIDSINEYINNNFEIQIHNKTAYKRLYSEKYSDAQLGYLEYFINSSDTFFIQDVDNVNVIDEIESKILADTIYSKTYTLVQHKQDQFVLMCNDRSSAKFNFQLK